MPSALVSQRSVLTDAEQRGLMRLAERGLLVSTPTPEPVCLPVIPSLKGKAQTLLDAVRGED